VTSEAPFAQILTHARAVKLGLEHRIALQARAHPQWVTTADARAIGLQGLWNVLRFAELSLFFIDRYLDDPQWWTEFRGSEPSIRQVAFEYTAYSQGSKFGVFHLGAAAFENTTRALLRAVAPGAANDARAEFQGVYTRLLRTHLAFPDEDLQLLELVRLVRNTIHNEGLHRPPSAKPASVSYRGVAYVFPESGPVEFATWLFVVDRVSDLADLLDRVIQSETVRAHTAHIPAPWAEILPPSAP